MSSFPVPLYPDRNKKLLNVSWPTPPKATPISFSGSKLNCLSHSVALFLQRLPEVQMGIQRDCVQFVCNSLTTHLIIASISQGKWNAFLICGFAFEKARKPSSVLKTPVMKRQCCMIVGGVARDQSGHMLTTIPLTRPIYTAHNEECPGVSVLTHLKIIASLWLGGENGTDRHGQMFLFI